METAFLLLADETARTVWRWGRVESNADLVLPLAAVAALAFFARAMIRLDGRELSPRVGWLLTGLRVVSILCLLVIFLQPEWRSERERVRNSRVLLLVDTSSSMGLADEPTGSAGATRLEHVAQALGKTDFLDRLRETHDLVLFGFDEELRRIASFDKAGDDSGGEDRTPSAPDGDDGSPGGPPSYASLLPAEGLTPSGAQTRLGWAMREAVHQERGSPLAGVIVFSDGGQNAGLPPEAAVEAARSAKVPLFTVGLGSRVAPLNVRVGQLEVPPRAYPGDPYVVTGLIQAQGLAGKSATVELLMREVDEEAAGGQGQVAGGRGDGADSPLPSPDSQLPSPHSVPVRSEEIILGDDGEAVPVKFELTPTETGRRAIGLRVLAPEADSDPSDDFREEEIEVVDRKLRVLLFAGGPTREYRFLRTLLHREASTTLDVLLQTGQPKMSQEADRLLEKFPASREEMFAYDCIVAFDPDWQQLTPGQVDLLEGWVAEQGGGLIAVAGPVHAGESIGGWIEAPDLAQVRALYPVQFQRKVTIFEGGAYASADAWPLDFTREGIEAEFLRLGDTATASRDAWDRFSGVYSFLPVDRAKPGAAVLARFSDPRAGQGDAERVYFAEQFYGSGRVFYAGSGEMWRLRGVDDAYFERFYTHLIRHVSAGRVLRQSSRGALMVDRDRYMPGGTVQIRARLTDAQLDPLEAARVPLNVIGPDGSVRTVMLQPSASRPGMFAGQLTVLGEGTYRLDLPVPESADERLTRRIKVTLPDLERRNPRRNDKLLSRIARATGGAYYPELEPAVDSGGAEPLVAKLKDRTKTIIQTASCEPPTLARALRQGLPAGLWRQAWFSGLMEHRWVRPLVDQTVLWWLMVVLCGSLCCEWLVRRLSKLA